MFDAEGWLIFDNPCIPENKYKEVRWEEMELMRKGDKLRPMYLTARVIRKDGIRNDGIRKHGIEGITQ